MYSSVANLAEFLSIFHRTEPSPCMALICITDLGRYWVAVRLDPVMGPIGGSMPDLALDVIKIWRSVSIGAFDMDRLHAALQPAAVRLFFRLETAPRQGHCDSHQSTVRSIRELPAV